EPVAAEPLSDFKIGDGVVAPVGLEDEGVAFGTAAQRVVAAASSQSIAAAAAAQLIVKLVADKFVAAGAADRVFDDDAEDAIVIEVSDVGGDGESAVVRGVSLELTYEAAASGLVFQSCVAQIDDGAAGGVIVDRGIAGAIILDGVFATGVPDRAERSVGSTV